uniref:Uncharacterized protein n=1 Tax=Setaria viridis TaxID=4556 RepID=A0A4U6TM23_SETVI|nr:hypothetical protein SEVIR_7G053900v2 [Setaria viridis]
MDGHENGYRDYFSQEGSSSAARSFPASPDVPDKDNFGPFSQSTSYRPRPPTSPHLDLNSQAHGSPHLGSYQEYLQAEAAPGDQRLPPFDPSCRSGRGGGHGVGHRSRSLTTGAGSGRGRGGGRGGSVANHEGRRGSVANREGRGSTFARNSSVPPEHVGALEVEGDNNFEGRSQSVRSKSVL